MNPTNPISPRINAIFIEPVPSTSSISSDLQLESKKKAHYILYEENQGKPYVPTNLKHFAQIQASTILGDTEFEGATLSEQEKIIHYWTSLISHWGSGKAMPIDAGLSKEEIDHVLQSLKDCEDFLPLFSANKSEEVKALLKQKFETQKVCYLPTGWQDFQGHFMLAKFENKGAHIEVSLLTKGGGAEYHDVTHQGPHKIKISYKSDPFIINKQILFENPVGSSFFNRLVTIDNGMNLFSIGVPKLEAIDLYGLFQLLANYSKETTDVQEQAIVKRPNIGVTPQRSGTCGDSGLRMTLYEALFEDQSTKNESDLKRSMFAFKLQSLIDAFREFESKLGDGDEMVILFLSHAVQSLLTRLNKLYPEILTDEEFALGVALGEEIKQKVEMAKEKSKENQPAIGMPELHSTEAIEQQCPALPKIESHGESTKASSPNLSPLTLMAAPEPKEVTAFLEKCYQEFAKYYSDLSSKYGMPSMRQGDHWQIRIPHEIFHQISCVFSVLPLPTGEIKDSYWDGIPTEEKGKCISNLLNLVSFAHLTAPSMQDALFVMSARAYDIACQLAPHIPELKMKGFAFNFANFTDILLYREDLNIDENHYSNLSFYQDIETEKIIKKIALNFKKRKERKSNAGRDFLFPKRFQADKSCSHWNYISQFYTGELKKKLLSQNNNDYSKALAAFVIDENFKFFPPNYYDLKILFNLCFPQSYKTKEPLTLNIDSLINSFRKKLWENFKYHEMGSLDNGIQYFSMLAEENALPIKKGLDHSAYLSRMFDNRIFYESENSILINKRFELIPEEFPIFRLNAPTKPKPENLSRYSLEELALIAPSDQLRISHVFDWLNDNIHLIHLPEVQACIEMYVFRYESLSRSLKTQHDPILEQIHTFLFSALDFYYSKRDNKTILWLARFGAYLEKYIHMTPSKGKSIELPDFYPVLEKMYLKATKPIEKIDILNGMLFSFYYLEADELTESEIGKILSNRAQVKILKNDAIRGTNDTDLEQEALHLYFHLRPAIKNFILKAEQEGISGILNQVLQFVFQAPFEFQWKKNIERDSTVFESISSAPSEGIYSFNIDTLQLFQDGLLLLDISSQASLSEDYREVFREELFISINRNGVHYKQPDETARIILEQKEIRIQKKILLHGIEYWMEYIPNLQAFKIPIPNVLNDRFQKWRSTEDSDFILFMDKKTHTFAYKYQPDQGLLELEPATGKTLPVRIVDLISGNSQRRDWIQFLEAFEPVKDILLKEIKNGDGSWDISSLEFPRLGLSFEAVKVKGEIRLKSNQFEDMFLSKTRNKDLLQKLRGPLQLENGDKTYFQMIIPFKTIRSEKSKKADLFSPIHFIPQGLYTGHEQPYFVYFSSSFDQSLKAETPRGALFLSLLLRNMHDYTNAYHYLQFSESMEKDLDVDWEIIHNQILEQSKPHIPARAAYDIHLQRRMKSQGSKHNKEKFATTALPKHIVEIQNEFDKHISAAIDYYNQTSSDLKEDISNIPMDLRLRTYPGGNPRKQNIADAVQLHQNSINEKEWDKLTQNLRFSDYSHVTKHTEREHFVRLLKQNRSSLNDYIKNSFFDFYNRACSPSSEDRELLRWDLFYLQRSTNEILDINEKETIILMLNVLNFVLENHKRYEKVDKVSNVPNAIKMIKGIYQEIQKEPTEVKPKISSSPAPQRITPIPTKAKLPEYTVTRTGQLSEVMKMEKKPLGYLFEKYFQLSKEKPFVNTPFPLENNKTKNSLSQKLLEDLREGHEFNREKRVKNYRVNDLNQLSTLHSDLIKDLKECEIVIEELKRDIGVLSNKLPLEPRAHLVEKTKLLGQQTRILTLDEPLLACFLTQDLKTLLKWNRNLSEQDITLLFKKIGELLIKGRHAKITEEALAIQNRLDRATTAEEKESLYDQLGKIFQYKTNYDIEKHPEYLVYEFSTGLILRKDQIELLDWIFTSIDQNKLEHLLFQFQAGGGKTKVLMPILALKFSQIGFFPILVSYTSLYEVSKHDLDVSLMSAFKQRLELLEIDLGTPLSIDQLDNIYHSLLQYRNEQKSLIIKFESLAALILLRKKAFVYMDIPLLDAVDKVLSFFKDPKSIALIDEAHLTLDPLQETNQAIGKSETLPQEFQQLFIDFLSLMTGEKMDIEVNTNRGKIPIQDKIRLSSNQQALLTAEDFVEIREALIPALLKIPPFNDPGKYNLSFFDITPEQFTELISSYLHEENCEMPQWISALHGSKETSERVLASTLVLAKKILYELMPHTLHLIQGISYGESIHTDDFTCAPRHDKKTTTSKFQDVMVTAFLTVQNTFQTGVKGNALDRLLKLLIDRHHEQKYSLEPGELETESQKLFNRAWGPDAPSIDTWDFNSDTDMALCEKKICTKPLIIEFFLKEIALPQIRTFRNKLTVTPPDFLNAFGKTISFTATPGTLELYPHQLQGAPSAKLDPGFEASVVEVLSRPENQGICFVDSMNLDSFFEEVYTQDPESFKKVTTLIDIGGLFRNQSNQEVVETFLRFIEKKNIKLNGAISKDDQKGSKTEGKLLLRQLSEGNLVSQALVGSDVPKALKKIGYNYYEMALMTLFGLEDTTGADYKQPDKGRADLTLGEGCTKTKTIQGAMRMRRVLLGKDGQTVRWIITKELADQIPKEKQETLTVQELFLWMLENEAKILEKAIIMRAFQGINHVIRHIAWDRVNAGKSAKEKISIYNQFRKGLEESFEIDPYHTYGHLSISNTEEVLRNHALNCYKSLGFEDSNLDHLSEIGRRNYELLIAQTTNLVKEMTIGQADLSSEMFQHQEVKQEQKQEQKQEVKQQQNQGEYRMTDSPEADYIHDIWHVDFLSDPWLKNTSKQGKTPHYRLKDKLPFDFLPDDLFVSENFLNVGHFHHFWEDKYFYMNHADIIPDKKADLIRPVKYMLVIQEKQPQFSYKYLLCTQKEANHFLKELDKKDLNATKIQKRAVLINSNGRIVKNGDLCGLSEDEVKTLQESHDFHKHLVLISFLNGKIKNLTLMKEITSNWTPGDFNNYWKKILDVKIDERVPNQQMIEELKKFQKKDPTMIYTPKLKQDSQDTPKQKIVFKAHVIKPKEPSTSSQDKVGWFSWMLGGKKDS